MLKNIVFRVGGFRKFHAFKRPPQYPKPDNLFKRPVVPSDFDVERELWCDNKYLDKKEFEKRGDKKGSDLYYPKYGSSIYDDKIKNEMHERYNSRED